MEHFNAEKVKTIMDSIEAKFDEFGKTLSETNVLVESLVQNGGESAIQGFVGEDLFSIWDNNATTFDTFKANFQNWYEVVQVISANNAAFAVEATATYRDLGSTLDGMEEARKKYASGETTLDDLTTGTTYEGFIPTQNDSEVWTSYEQAAAAGFPNIRTAHEFSRGGDDKEKYGTYQNYLKAMYDKYVGNGNEGEGSASPELLSPETPAPTDGGNGISSTPVTIGRGSVVKLGNGNYNYYGTTKGGKNIYTDSNQDLYYEDENGNAVNITRSQYVGGTNTQTVNFNVKDIGASYNVHGENVPIVLSVDGEYVGYGATANSNINTSIVYENSNVAPNVVTTIAPGEGNDSAYRVGATNMNVDRTTDAIVVPTQSSEFMNAINNHQDIKITANSTLKYDPSGILNTSTLTNGQENVYLRYDEGTELYYIANADGSYSTTSTGYDPSVFTNGDSYIKFN